jgi:hypothetical protein
MDGEFRARVCAQLARGRQENSLVRPNYEHANLHHGSVVPRLSRICHYLLKLSRHLMDDEPAFAPEEFFAEENLNFDKDASVDEGVKSDDETVKTSNLPAPPNDELHSQAI